MPTDASPSALSAPQDDGQYVLIGYSSPNRLYVRVNGRMRSVLGLFEPLPGRCGIRFVSGDSYDCGDFLPPPTPAGASPRGEATDGSDAGFARTRRPPPPPPDSPPDVES